MRVTQKSSTKLSDCESECESELPDGRAEALPSVCVPLLNCVSIGIVGGRADVLPFTCVAIDMVRRSEIGRTDVFVLSSPRVTVPRCGRFLPYEPLLFRRCVACCWSPRLRHHPFDTVG